jgi:hypothetical protein
MPGRQSTKSDEPEGVAVPGKESTWRSALVRPDRVALQGPAGIENRQLDQDKENQPQRHSEQER